MKMLCACYNKAVGGLVCLSWLPPLLMRITIGVVFIESGWGKLQHLDKVAAFFESLGIPGAHYQAPFVAGTEFVAGALVLVGLLTRIASVPLTIIMVMALATAKRAEINGWTDVFGLSEFLYIVLLLGLIICGAGKISVDAMACRGKNVAGPKSRSKK